MKQLLRNSLPPATWHMMKMKYWDMYYAYQMTLNDTAWQASTDGRQSIQRLHSLKNKHQGKRCFIIGNGPSLNQTDLTLLKNEYTFGLNRIYLMFPKLGFTTTYLVSVNELVIRQCADEIQQLPLPKFIPWRLRDVIKADDQTIFMRPVQRTKFSKSPTYCLYEGGTVTYVAMQLAYYMGFQQVILIGVDHNFVTQGPANQEVVSTGQDPNHFSGEYFGKGFRWQLPDLVSSEQSYQLARTTYERAGRQIIDATVGGKLTVYPKVSYESLFAQPVNG